MPDTPLTWAGHGDVIALGLDPDRITQHNPRNAAIYVGPSEASEGGGIVAGEEAWCATYPDGSGVMGAVPEGWQPP